MALPKRGLVAANQLTRNAIGNTFNFLRSSKVPLSGGFRGSQKDETSERLRIVC